MKLQKYLFSDDYFKFIYGQRATPTMQESKKLEYVDKEVLTLIIGNGSVSLNNQHQSYLLSAKKLEQLGFLYSQWEISDNSETGIFRFSSKLIAEIIYSKIYGFMDQTLPLLPNPRQTGLVNVCINACERMNGTRPT